VAITIELPNPRRLAFGVVVGQAAVTLAAAVASGWLGGERAAVSALLGGGVSTAGSLAMALIGFRSHAHSNALSILARLLLGEAAKLAVVIVLFGLVLMLIKVAGVAMLVTYAATFLVYWIVLVSGMRMEPRLERGLR